MYYSTEDEMLYIRTIGTHHGSCKGIPKDMLLKRYLIGCEKRVNWGTLNSAAVINFAKSELVRHQLAKGE